MQYRASVVPVDALRSGQSKQVDEQPIKTDVEVTAAIENASVAVETPAYQPEHFLIVATFHSAKEAERYVEANNSQEFPLQVVPSRKLTRVSVASSFNKDELFKMLNSPEISHRFPNAWVWSNS